jgi:site-specific DNA-methyltransferase (adenine-specific)
VYGSGFPKSLDVSKALDKVNGESGRLHKFTAYMRTTGLTAKQINDTTGTFMGSHYLTDKSQPAIPTCALWSKLRPLCGEVPAWVDELVQRIEAEREVVGQAIGTDTAKARLGMPGQDNQRREYNITAPATPEAQQWAGWGTALKPALEPITVARKPLAGNVAANVLAHGTGAINVNSCRVEGDRWPSNLLHDGSDEPSALLSDASRFFYTAKVTRAERQGVTHPTVKPLDLMAYLCRLVTPPGGIVLDPFMGTGTTIKAAISEGFSAIGIERDPAYFAMAEHRMKQAQIGLTFAEEP